MVKRVVKDAVTRMSDKKNLTSRVTKRVMRSNRVKGGQVTSKGKTKSSDVGGVMERGKKGKVEGGRSGETWNGGVGRGRETRSNGVQVTCLRMFKSYGPSCVTGRVSKWKVRGGNVSGSRKVESSGGRGR